LDVELVEVEVAENELAKFLLEEELANPLESPAREGGLGGFGKVEPREHGYGKENWAELGLKKRISSGIRREVAATNHKAP